MLALAANAKPELRLVRFLDDNPKLGDEFSLRPRRDRPIDSLPRRELAASNSCLPIRRPSQVSWMERQKSKNI